MGRPRKYTAKTLEREVKKYFDSITREVTVTELVDSGEYDQYGHMIRKPVPELCGLNPDAVRRYERGEQKPGMDALIAMSDLLEVSIDYLVCNNSFRLHE